jgi:hypothetical protein
MKIKTIGSVKNNGEYLNPGSVIEINDVDGQNLINAGAAILVQAAAPAPSAGPGTTKEPSPAIPSTEPKAAPPIAPPARSSGKKGKGRK